MSLKTHHQAITITLTSDPKQICVARTAVETFVAREGFPKEQTEQIGLALNEALANVIEHGYSGDTGQTIAVTMEMTEHDGRRALELLVKDQGRQVDPGTIKSRNLDEVRPGGLGVHIMNTVMDKVVFCCPLEGGTELRMIKCLDESERTEQ